MFYYIVVTLLCGILLVLSVVMPNEFLLARLPRVAANLWLGLLWATLLVKPVFIVLMKYTELKTLSFTWLRDYLKTIKWRSLKWLWYMLLSVVYFIAGLGMKRRRQLGITSFLIVFVHAILWVVQWIQTGIFARSQIQQFRLLTGYIWLLMLFVGYITSNDYSIRLFKKNRKLIQYSAYLALLFTLLHLAFINFWEYVTHYIIFIIYIVLKRIEKKYSNLPK